MTRCCQPAHPVAKPGQTLTPRPIGVYRQRRVHEDLIRGPSLLVALHFRERVAHVVLESFAARESVDHPRPLRYAREDLTHSTPRGSLARLGRVARQKYERIQVMLVTLDPDVRPAADKSPEGDDRLQKDGGRIGFGVRSNGGCDIPQKAAVGGFPSGSGHGTASRCAGESRLILCTAAQSSCE